METVKVYDRAKKVGRQKEIRPQAEIGLRADL